MLELKTLVPDIYALLDKLNNGETVEGDIGPHIDKCVEDIREAIMHWATPQIRSRHDGLRMSNIGKPNRRLYYDLNDDNEEGISNEHPSLQIKFLYGHILEQILLMLAKAAGHAVTCEQQEVNVEGIKGHMDSVIDGEVVDVKTASSFSFKKFATGQLAEDDAFGYLPQLAGYEEAKGTRGGGFFVIDKVTGEICLYIPEDLDKPNIVSRIAEAKGIKELDTPPELCYPDIPNGKAGNMTINRLCGFCPHKELCRADANDGAGLRKFQYSGKIEYFTEVIKAPRVEEIL
jgi:hypothetical protein